MRMLLVARKGRAKDRFVAELEALGAKCDVASTPEELLAATQHRLYNGVLFDVLTIIRGKDFDRTLLQSLAEVYPSARLKYVPASDTVFVLGNNVGPGSRDGLSIFVAACRNFLPRRLRRGKRVDVHLPVVLWRSQPQEGDSGERTCTTNISFLGCFVFTTTDWAVDDTAWLEFPDLAVPPIEARVAWREPWGQRRAVPGIGLAFPDFPPAFADALRALGCSPVDLEVATQPKGL